MQFESHLNLNWFSWFPVFLHFPLRTNSWLSNWHRSDRIGKDKFSGEGFLFPLSHVPSSAEHDSLINGWLLSRRSISINRLTFIIGIQKVLSLPWNKRWVEYKCQAGPAKSYWWLIVFHKSSMILQALWSHCQFMLTKSRQIKSISDSLLEAQVDMTKKSICKVT